MKSKIVELCDSLGIAAIKASFRNLGDAPRIVLDEADFLLSIQAETPKAVYIYEAPFEPIEFVELEVENSELDMELDDDGKILWSGLPGAMEEISQILVPVSSMTGSAYFLTAIFSEGGLYRFHSCQAIWAEELSSRIQDIIRRLLEIQESSLENDAREVQAIINNLVDEIAASEDFRKIRGLPKRLLWVQAKYKNRIPIHPQGHLDRVAQNTEMVDANLAFVVTKANEKIWMENNVTD